MQIPMQITFKDIPASEAVEAKIREKAAKLERFHDHIISCRVVVSKGHQHHNKGNLYQVHIDIKTPRSEIVATRSPDQHHAHEDVYVAIRDAFNAVTRQLEDLARVQRKEVKTHEVPLHGIVTRLMPGAGHGWLETPDGLEVYFHRHSVLNESFDDLEVGSEVRFDLEQGEQGPQASSVHVIGKHHIVG